MDATLYLFVVITVPSQETNPGGNPSVKGAWGLPLQHSKNGLKVLNRDTEIATG